MKAISSLLFAVLALTSCNAEPKGAKEGKIKPDEKVIPEKTETINLGAGCYWCVEAIFQQLDGVVSVTSGFMGGHIPNPTYEQVCSKTSGHIEVVKVVYDPKVISTKTILKWFWKAHDPTDAGGQGADRGPQYATAIFYSSDEQKRIAEESKKIAQAAFDKPIATTIRKVEEFYEAQADHQDFYFNNKKNGYCRAVINPKLEKLNLEK
ncbi:peptide-methionine (S)-S-oxide reductase MsrA [Akkermansiaceae bacterium]|nr:peptide-methionine (S)-S-oxide reductase MsrA [Akkermansiaceae bacterium]MDB4387820.1 peptide-methionine (S)-S-oxide reductase MsrA [Akkermansiaceae bacterium]MDB4467134.1 peptide-methionine (S)-S-oxide reductase MsrA [Akkermansiaceae bacterium]